MNKASVVRPSSFVELVFLVNSRSYSLLQNSALRTPHSAHGLVLVLTWKLSTETPTTKNKIR